ncbi:MAG TPA: hypothetical protein DDW28_00775 [Prevotella sp.]|nr:hypothetical protein [uncultured Prevotella sp.]HBF04698.1 hypothetical protein [Candidatus Segatella violae]
MKKRKKSKDESCITSLFKTALFIGIFLWGMICMSRTVNYKSWAVLIIIGVSFLLVKLFKNDDYVGEHTMYCSALLGAAVFASNFYFPTSIQQREAVIQRIYIDKNVGRHSVSKLTHYVLYFTDNGQKNDIYGGLAKYKYHEGDTVSVTYQHGWIGWDVVADIKK